LIIPETADRRTHEATPPLAREHWQMLTRESGISGRIVSERGYSTASRRDQVPDVFPDWQRRRGLVIPVYSPDGETTSYQLRPDKPRNRKRKYEQPAGVGCILDVHPSMMHAVADPSVPLWITEGVKKGDALTSRECCAVSIVGVWNWQRKAEPLPCWDHVALEGRECYVVFDSDVMVKPEVQLALERLATFLQGRGAVLQVVYLPEVVNG
jgi:hypothetical protein